MSATCEGVPSVPTGSTFTVWDYLVFCVVLAISAAIGLYYAFSGGKQKTTAEFLFADKSMSAFPVALSMLASFFSATVLLGMPSEIYMHGTMFWMCVWSIMLTPIVGAVIFGPFIYRLKIRSIFEYLEVRYESRAVRIFGCLFYIIKLMVLMGTSILGPATTLTEVTGVPVWGAILMIGAVSSFYTTLGGIKAVIWTDVFQSVLILAGILAPIIQGCIEIGGIENAWKLAEDGGRIEFFDFNPDPTVRYTTWTLFVGMFFNWLPNYSMDQRVTQRYASTKNKKQATIALLLTIVGLFIVITLTSLLGIVMYGYYAPLKCDPLKSGRVSNPNQLAPRFVMDIFHFAPGIPGLYVGSIFAGALSAIASMLNALPTVVWEDILKVFRPAREASDKTATVVAKILGIFFAIVGTATAFVFNTVSGTVLEIALALNGAAVAPMVGIFILGFFFPWANWIGAVVGGILGFAFPMWLSIGAYVKQPLVMKPLYYSVECCDATPDNSTSSYFYSSTDIYTTPTATVPEVSGIVQLYTLSYLWYTTLGMLTTIIVGLIVSFLTGYTKPKDIDPKLLISYVDTFWCCFPEPCRSKYRCGIDFSKVEDQDPVSQVKDSTQSLEIFHNGKNIVFVHPDKTDLTEENSNKKPSPEDANLENVLFSEKALALAADSNHDDVNHRSVGCDNDAYEKCPDEIEISQL